MTVADEILERHREALDGWDGDYAFECRRIEEDAPVLVAADLRVRHRLHPGEFLMLQMSCMDGPGADFESDVKLAVTAASTRRVVDVFRAHGLDDGFADSHLELVDWVCEHLGPWPAGDWSAAVTECAERMVEARRTGWERGRASRADSSEEPVGAGWLLRHPADHWISTTRRSTPDSWLRNHIDRLLPRFRPSYEALGTTDFDPASAADIACVIEIEQAPISFKDPIVAEILHSQVGELSPGRRLLVRQVARRERTFNGKLLSTLPGERWLLRGTIWDDGTVTPADGTRRLQAGAIGSYDSS